MAAVTISEMLAAEAKARSNGWTEEGLLDLAGERLGHAIGRFFRRPGTAIGYLGKGHNAGDTIVALGILRDGFGWNIGVRMAFPLEQCAPLTRRKWDALGLAPPLARPPSWLDVREPLLLLDGLLGTGCQGALRGPLLPLAEEMEWFRQNTGARVAAVDLPSGINADSGEVFPGGVTADATFMIGNAKRGLLASHAVNSTGALALVPVEPLAVEGPSDMDLVCPQTMRFAKVRRPFDFHKGNAGRVAIIGGSDEYSGAAALAATGALRGGAGLVSLYVPVQTATAIKSRCPPEVIVRGYSEMSQLDGLAADSLVVGCGIGKLNAADQEALLGLLASSRIPSVVDADALNLIAISGRLDILSQQHVLTPHPGEFRRLAPDLADLDREAAAREFTKRVPATLLLKGCRTLITHVDHPLWCNSTGNPGMATGGQGDLLAGVIGARLAFGDPPLEASALSAWLCGRAAEIVLQNSTVSEESMIASDVGLHLGGAYNDWRSARR